MHNHNDNIQDTFAYKKTSVTDKLKIFSYVLAIFGIIGLGHSAISQKKSRNAVITPSHHSKKSNSFLNIVQGLMNSEATSSQKGMSFYFPKKSDDGLENSFYDISLSYLKGKNGKLIAKIDDILVSSTSGTAKYILYYKGDEKPLNGYNFVNYTDVLVEESDGDIILSTTKSEIPPGPNIKYSKKILSTYISLKYLREADVVNQNGNLIGKVRAIIYDDNKLQEIYVVPTNGHTSKVNMYSYRLDDLSISYKNGGYDVRPKEEIQK